jgi:hypothetical protein
VESLRDSADAVTQAPDISERLIHALDQDREDQRNDGDVKGASSEGNHVGRPESTAIPRCLQASGQRP